MTGSGTPPASVSKPDRPAHLDDTKKAEYDKAEFDKGLELWLEARKQEWANEASKTALDDARDDALVAAETASVVAIQAAYVATTQSTLDRALTRTNVLTASVGTIITLYTGLLAFIYTKAETATGGTTGVRINPLQPVALVPVVFLAASLFLATVYAAVLRNKTTVGPFLPTGIGGQVAELRLVTYMNWCFAGVLARRWALHAGITSLGIGVATLPLPFTDTSHGFQLTVFVAGVCLVVLTAAWTQWGTMVWSKVKKAPSGA